MRPSASSGIVIDVGDRLAPRQLVAVVLVRADEHDRALGGAGSGRRGRSARRAAAGRRRPRTWTRRSIAAVEPEPTKMTTCSSVAPTASFDDLPRLGPEAGRLEARPRDLGVRVRVEREDGVAQVVLDERQAAAGRRVVGVGHPAHAERPGHGLVVADHGAPDEVDELRGRRRCRGRIARAGGRTARPGGRDRAAVRRRRRRMLDPGRRPLHHRHPPIVVGRGVIRGARCKPGCRYGGGRARAAARTAGLPGKSCGKVTAMTPGLASRARRAAQRR